VCRVARARVRLGADLVSRATVRSHRTPHPGCLAPALAVAGARGDELPRDARELRLLRAVANDGVGAAVVADLPGGRAFGVVARVERAPAAAAPLDGELALPAAELRLAVEAARARAVVGAAVADVRLGAVADERLAVVVATAAPLQVSRTYFLFTQTTWELLSLQLPACRCSPPRLALAGDEDEESERERRTRRRRSMARACYRSRRTAETRRAGRRSTGRPLPLDSSRRAVHPPTLVTPPRVALAAGASFAACSTSKASAGRRRERRRGRRRRRREHRRRRAPDDVAIYPEAPSLRAPDGCYLQGAVCMDDTTCCSAYCVDGGCTLTPRQQ